MPFSEGLILYVRIHFLVSKFLAKIQIITA